MALEKLKLYTCVVSRPNAPSVVRKTPAAFPRQCHAPQGSIELWEKPPKLHPLVDRRAAALFRERCRRTPSVHKGPKTTK